MDWFLCTLGGGAVRPVLSSIRGLFLAVRPEEKPMRLCNVLLLLFLSLPVSVFAAPERITPLAHGLLDGVGLACDEQGGCFVSLCRRGEVVRVAANGKVAVVARGIKFPTGIVRADDGAVYCASAGKIPFGRCPSLPRIPQIQEIPEALEAMLSTGLPMSVCCGMAGLPACSIWIPTAEFCLSVAEKGPWCG